MKVFVVFQKIGYIPVQGIQGGLFWAVDSVLSSCFLLSALLSVLEEIHFALLPKAAFIAFILYLLN
jgi:hypothetical protein